MKRLITLLLFTFTLAFTSCDDNYKNTDVGKLTVLQHQSVQASDTCLVFTDVENGKSLMYHIDHILLHMSRVSR